MDFCKNHVWGLNFGLLPFNILRKKCSADRFNAPAVLTEAKAGKLKIAVGGNDQSLTEALAVAFNTKKPPAGDLIFTKLSIRNRSMRHPPRASAEIDATCIWIEAGGTATGFDVTVRTHSISLDDESQLKYLRDQALEGMVTELAEAL